MNLSAFWRSLKRSWLAALLLFEVGLLGSTVYARKTIQSTAEATVAVRDPITARPGYQAAQITFDAVVSSHRLSERVAERMGETVSAVEAALSVKVIAPAATGFNISPLYAVQGKKPDEQSALGLVNTAVEEARKLFVELNDSKIDEVTSTLSAERQAAQQAAREAEGAFDAFDKANDTSDLKARLDSEVTRAEVLRTQVTTTSADLAAAQSVGEPVTIQAVEQRLRKFAHDLSTAEAERDRLRSLASRHDDLSAEVTRARAKDEELANLEKQTVLSQILPLESQIKVLDDAQIQSQTLLTMLIYAVGVVLGLLASATAVYLRYLSDENRETSETISLAFGAPVLARIPPGSLGGALR
jgi:hypothetical protein